MEKFCKLFETEEYGQILVKLDMNTEDSPEVRIYFQPEDLGVCSVALTHDDNDEGWERAEKSFNSVDEEKAKTIVGKLVVALRGNHDSKGD